MLTENRQGKTVLRRGSTIKIDQGLSCSAEMSRLVQSGNSAAAARLMTAPVRGLADEAERAHAGA
jgi:hypothetical protein